MVCIYKSTVKNINKLLNQPVTPVIGGKGDNFDLLANYL